MLKIHTSNGHTAQIDWGDEGQAREWISRLRDSGFQRDITAISIAHRGVQYSVTKPTGFDQTFFLPELIHPDPSRRIKGGERIVCFAGDVRATVMVHDSQRAARISLTRVGKLRYNPWQERD